MTNLMTCVQTFTSFDRVVIMGRPSVFPSRVGNLVVRELLTCEGTLLGILIESNIGLTPE